MSGRRLIPGQPIYRVKIIRPGMPSRTLRFRFRSEGDARTYMRTCYSNVTQYKVVQETIDSK